MQGNGDENRNIHKTHRGSSNGKKKGRTTQHKENMTKKRLRKSKWETKKNVCKRRIRKKDEKITRKQTRKHTQQIPVRKTTQRA